MQYSIWENIFPKTKNSMQQNTINNNKQQQQTNKYKIDLASMCLVFRKIFFRYRLCIVKNIKKNMHKVFDQNPMYVENNRITKGNIYEDDDFANGHTEKNFHIHWISIHSFMDKLLFLFFFWLFVWIIFISCLLFSFALSLRVYIVWNLNFQWFNASSSSSSNALE